MSKLGIIFGVILFAWISYVNGCHNALDGSSRKKRQAPSTNNVERTENIREFFSDCLMERAGPMFDWNSVVDFSILDTLWYEVTNEESCSNDTVLCWQNRLEAYLRPNSDVLPFARSCIAQLGEEVRDGRFRHGRKKRSYHHSYYYTTTTQSPEEVLLGRFSSCVGNRIILPRNRQKLNVKSLVQFVDENAICGECSEVQKPSYTPHYGYRGSQRWKRSTSYSSLNSVRSLVSSWSSQYVAVNVSAHSDVDDSSIEAFPFIFQGLTLQVSPLFNSIVSCNQRLEDEFIPNPCEGLGNRKEDSFCEEQQSWCDNYPSYMNSSCTRSCCERFNMPFDGFPNIGWTEWTPWGACPAPCGRTAVQVRKRTCPLGVPGVDPCIGDARETRVCQSQGCASWSGWNSWTPCQVTCGRQTQVSERRCVGGEIGDTGCTGLSRRFQMCDRGQCRGTWTKWGSWSKCPVTCGGKNTNVQRSRSCQNGRVGDLGCEGPEVERRECGRHYCPQRTVWSDWSSWSECTYRKRVRHCVGGAQGSCQGDSVVYEKCQGCRQPTYPPPTTTTRYVYHTTRRPLQPTWTAWSSWSLCDGNCSFAVQRRRRTCQHANSAYSRCSGNSIQSETCIPAKCFLFRNGKR